MKAVKKEKSNSESIDFKKELWEAAVNLRGAIEPSDYKRFVLPLIFLRYLNTGYIKTYNELDGLTRNKKSDYYCETDKERKAILEDPSFYQERKAFLLPKEARWGYILENAQKDDNKIILDKALAALEKEYPKQLKGLLPPTFAGSNLSRENLAGLINLFSAEKFSNAISSLDFLGQVYEYFIGEFASTEGKRGGEFFTARSVVKTLVAMLEPEQGKVFDPCCGSGGMFVQADEFTKHSGNLSFYGQESKEFTFRLARINLFIHGMEGNIQMGNSYTNDLFADLKADYVIANPPFNDGSKSEAGWGADLINSKDTRLTIGTEKVSLAKKNANYMWMLHFLHHLNENGTAGFVMANGAMTTSVSEEKNIREILVKQGFVDCIVRMPEKLFANTGIPCCLWFLSKNRKGNSVFRERKNEVLFIDASKMGSLIPGSRKQKYLSDEEIDKIASAYQNYRKKKGKYQDVGGFCKLATKEEIQNHGYKLAPGIYVGTETAEEDDTPFEEKMKVFKDKLFHQFEESSKLASEIKKNLNSLKAE
jgi:type I restriction enzyme M protein